MLLCFPGDGNRTPLTQYNSSRGVGPEGESGLHRVSVFFGQKIDIAKTQIEHHASRCVRMQTVRFEEMRAFAFTHS